MDTVSKAEYDALMSKFMTMQRDVEALRKQPTEAQLLQNLLMNPVGTLKARGFADDHIEFMRNSLIADKLGPNAPMPLQIAANQGPMMAQLQMLQQAVATLADSVTKTKTDHSLYTEREKLKSVASNASKNPYLAKAYAKNPEKFNGLLASQGGTAEDFIAKQEAELKEIAEALGVAPPVTTPPAGTPAASVNAGKQGEGKNATIASAQSGLLNDVPVPKSPSTPEGKWSKDTFAQLKERLVAQATKPESR